MKHLKRFESISNNQHDYMINDIKDILIDFKDLDVNLDKKKIHIVDWWSVLSWNEEVKLTFQMLNSYLNDNWEADRVYFNYNGDPESLGYTSLTMDEFINNMVYGKQVTNLSIYLI
jgi:hypothetical protein